MTLSRLNQLNLLHILNDGFLVSLPLLLPFIQKDLNITLTHVGFLGSALNSFQIILAIPAAIIAAKIGSFKSLVFALGLYGLGYLFTGAAPNLIFLVIAFVISGIGFGIFHPIAFSLVDAWSDKAKRGRFMGNFTAIGDIGRIVIAAGITVIAAAIGWRSTSFVYGAIALVAFVLMFKHINHKSDLSSNPTDRVKIEKYVDLLSNRRFLLVTLAGALDSLATSAIFVFLPFLLLTKGADASLLGTYAAAFFVGNMAGKSLLGRLVDHVGNNRIFFSAEIIMSMVILVIAFSNSLVVIISLSILLGALSKGTVPVLMTMVAESVENMRSKEKAYALNTLVSGFGTVAAPLVMGKLSDDFSISTAFIVSAALTLIATTPIILHRMMSIKSLNAV